MIIPDHVPQEFRHPGDAAKRCSYAVCLAASSGCAGRWLAIRLQDGGCDHVPYPTREDAIRHQLRPEHCCYVLVPPDGMQPWEAEAFLDYWRKLHSANVRDDQPDVRLPLMPLTAGDRRRQIRVLAKGRR